MAQLKLSDTVLAIYWLNDIKIWYIVERSNIWNILCLSLGQYIDDIWMQHVGWVWFATSFPEEWTTFGSWVIRIPRSGGIGNSTSPNSQKARHFFASVAEVGGFGILVNYIAQSLISTALVSQVLACFTMIAVLQATVFRKAIASGCRESKGVP